MFIHIAWTILLAFLGFHLGTGFGVNISVNQFFGIIDKADIEPIRKKQMKAAVAKVGKK